MNEEEKKEFQGHGFRLVGREDIGTLEVCRWPDRTNVSISIAHGSVVKPLAYFRDDECAKEFVRWIEDAFIALGALRKDG